MSIPGKRVEAPRVVESKMVRVETPKASRRHGEWKGCFSPRPIRSLGSYLSGIRRRATVAKAFSRIFTGDSASDNSIIRHFLIRQEVLKLLPGQK